MAEAIPARWLRSLCVDLGAWLTIALLFVATYIFYFGNPGSIALSHLFLLLAIWAGIVGLRVLLWGLFGRLRVAPYLSATIAVLPWMLLALWYCVALVGLVSWGRITTWPIIRTYGGQSQFLLSTLGLPVWLVWVPAVVAALAVFFLGRASGMRPDWPSVLIRSNGRSKALLLASLMALFPVALFGTMYNTAPLDRDEPIQLSFFPTLATLKESNYFSASPAVNAAEVEARRAYKPANDPKPRNVILIVGDALRGDRMGANGYGRSTTPYLSSLLASGKAESLPRMRATCAESVCGYMALASSRPIQAMPAKAFTLHEALKRNGYGVHLIFSGDHTNFYGLREMYGPVDSYFDGSQQRYKGGGDLEVALRYMNDDQLVLDRLDKLPDADGKHPIFLQIVLMSSHGLGLRKKGSERFKPSLSYYRLFGKTTNGVSRTELDAAGRFYDNGVLQLDGYVEQLIATLEAKGYLKDALVVLTGDHGEMLGEHTLIAHGVGVYEPVLDIPLMLTRFGYAAPPLARHRVASQIDIAPTIMRELGLPIPGTWLGVPLQSPERKGPVYFQQVAEAGMYADEGAGGLFKYWRDFSTDQEYVFDVERDPGELRNLVRSIPPSRLSKWRLQVAHGGLQVGVGGRTSMKESQTLSVSGD